MQRREQINAQMQLSQLVILAVLTRRSTLRALPSLAQELKPGRRPRLAFVMSYCCTAAGVSAGPLSQDVQKWVIAAGRKH